MKIEEARESVIEQGGAITKPRKRSPKKHRKIEEANEALIKQGGAIKKRKYFDPIHKHLMENLSGRGGAFDTPFVRKKMHELLSYEDPTVFDSYMKGRLHNLPQFYADHPGKHIKEIAQKSDPESTVIDFGGSLNPITHSEDGFLMAHDSTFYHQVHIV